MNHPLKNLFSRFSSCLFILLYSFVANADSASTQASVKSITVQFAPYEMIQLIAPVTAISKNTGEAEALRRDYYTQAIPLAQAYGFKNLGQLQVDKTLVGDFKPPAYIIGSWPSVAAFDAFSDLPQWPELKALRKQAWDELKLFNSEIPSPTKLTFREDKHYSVVFAWVNPQNPTDYFTYLEGIEKALNRVGGRFILKLKQPTLESHTDDSSPPNQITFVEWETENGFAALREQPDYQEFTSLRDSGIAKLEFHLLSPRITQMNPN